MSYFIELPYPPSTNNLYRTGRDGKRYKTEAAKSHAHAAGMLARVQFPKPLEGRLKVGLWVAPPRGIGQDLDNVLKATLDALTGICWKDDSQIWKLLVVRCEAKPGGGVLFGVEELPTEDGI